MYHRTNTNHKDSYTIPIVRCDQVARVFSAIAVDEGTGPDVGDSVVRKVRRGSKDKSGEGTEDQKNRAKCDFDHDLRKCWNERSSERLKTTLIPALFICKVAPERACKFCVSLHHDNIFVDVSLNPKWKRKTYLPIIF